ncbi:hypothetical protein QQO24_01745 [Ralstonia pseudosolanacearum]|uniref:hypothetical protein n=1 Tax=Ralstonia pseudosolanacearum TaxID=1310165 RepID=UPI0025B3F616|nr:hypothetical protein [Ralstonia pseudosolanacearum]MDN3365894.1 hypothetical protein [Ralstonia pseudosolanacearum]
MVDLGHHLWALTDHVCRHCLARILARPGEDEREVFRCSNCGAERAGDDESVLCACSLPNAECRPNDDISPLWPGEIVAVDLST